MHPDDFDVTTMPARFAEVGDLFAPLVARTSPAEGTDAVAPGVLDGLLELAAQDERDHDLGDLPYPPEYPKMPGEPKRVQPSKDRDRAKEPAED